MRCNWTKNLSISDTLSAYTSGMEKAKRIKNLPALKSPLENLVMGVIPGITSTGGGDSSGVPAPLPWEQLEGTSGGAETHRQGKQPQNTDLRIFLLAELFLSPTTGMVLLDTCSSTGASLQTCQQFRKLLAYETWVAWGFF